MSLYCRSKLVRIMTSRFFSYLFSTKTGRKACSEQIRDAAPGILYRVFDYGDEPQVNETHGGAIIRQLVCSGYCYLMLMPKGSPLIPPVVYAAVRERRNRFQTHRNEKARLPFLSPPLRRTTGWWCTEEADSGMPRAPIRVQSFQPVRHVPSE